MKFEDAIKAAREVMSFDGRTMYEGREPSRSEKMAQQLLAAEPVLRAVERLADAEHTADVRLRTGALIQKYLEWRAAQG